MLRDRKIFYYPLISGIFCLLLFQMFCTTVEKKSLPASQGYAGLTDTVHYVGINTCKGCHQSIYNTFIETGMGKSFEAASRKKSSAVFNNKSLVYDKDLDYYYHPYWDGDSLRVKEFRMAGKDTVHQRTEMVSFIVGSGQHTNSHIMNTNGYLHQVPVTYYTQKGTWDLAPGFDNGKNTRFRRLIGLECMSCHNAYPDFVQGSENKYTRVMGGIDCERCHGPGSAHVQLKSSGNLVDISRQIDYSIVNPSKLPVNLQFDVCQRCHIQGNAVLNDDNSFFDFRPGMPLSSVMNVFMPLYKGMEEEHIMASHAERLKQSRCYLETVKRSNLHSQTEGEGALRPYKNALTCVTCHNPHVSVKVTGKEIFNAACVKCHQQGKDIMCSENHATLAKMDNNCTACHMKKSGATDIPHVQVTDHRIAIPVKEKDIAGIKKFIGITCINNPNPSREAIGKAFLAYYEKFGFDRSMLDSAARYFPDRTEKDVIENFHSLIQLSFLRNNYVQIIKYAERVKGPLNFLNKKSYSNNDAWCCYRIAEAFEALKYFPEALKYYRRTIELAPNDLDFQNKYGASLLKNNRADEAKKVFEFIITEDPEYFQALSNLGYLYLTLDNDTVKARELYTRALDLNPDYENAMLNMTGLYIYRGRIKEAKEQLRLVLKKNPANEQAKMLLQNLQKSSL
jgi:hypothetical protein